MGYLLSQQLVAAGETVLDVPATLASRVRVLGTGQSTKTDPNDARSVAVAVLHAPTLATVRPADHVTVCRLLAKRHTDVARWRTKLCCRLHALVGELVPGGISKEVVVNQARSRCSPRSSPMTWRRSSGTARPSSSSPRSNTSISSVRTPGPGSPPRGHGVGDDVDRDLSGVGPIVAAMLIGFSGDPLRFTTANRYAAYTGTAPYRVLFRRADRAPALTALGNRRLNDALHCAAITQIRHPHSPGRGYYERKLAEGHTPV